MGTRAVLFNILLAVVTLVLGIVLHDSTAVAVVLFTIAGLATAALIIHAVVNSDWFWRGIARRVGPHLETGAEVISVSALPGPSDEAVREAVDDLLDELATIDGRLAEAIDREYYAWDFFLPSAEYAKHRSTIGARSGEVRQAISAVYVDTDALNGKMPGGDSDGIGMHFVNGPDASELRTKVEAARAALTQLRP
jgi:hypothetical protein